MKKYHDILTQEGIMIKYNSKVHAKIITVDRFAAIVSSMNFKSHSSGGGSWEAGLISIDQLVVESIAQSILNLIEKPEFLL
jgi:phosphatidylserine/phosphatidylglycerophosphate/cardiolipin synthase-like enzyme